MKWPLACPDGLLGYLPSLPLSWLAIICIDPSQLINTNCSNVWQSVWEAKLTMNNYRNYTVSGCLTCCCPLVTIIYLQPALTVLFCPSTHIFLDTLSHNASITSRECLVKYGLVQTVNAMCTTTNSTQFSRFDPSNTRWTCHWMKGVNMVSLNALCAHAGRRQWYLFVSLCVGHLYAVLSSLA